MKRILFVKLSDSSFVVQDEEILKRHFQVTSYTFGTDKGFGLIINQFKMFYFLLLNIWKFDTIYIWFADFQAFFPSLFSKILSKNTIIILGGYDVAKIKSISYGAHISTIRSWIIKISVRMANQVLPVSNYVLEQAKLNIYKTVSEKSNVVYNAIDTDFFKYQAEEKKNTVVSVCGSNDMKRAELKGVLHFIKAAKSLPSINFILIGIGNNIINKIKDLAPNNLEVTGFLLKDELREIYNTSKVVCQLSTIESFGVAIAEAMACQCIPVVSNVGGLKEVVDTEGYRVDREDYEVVKSSIESAIVNYSEKHNFVDRYIQEKFSINNREVRLIEIVNS